MQLYEFIGQAVRTRRTEAGFRQSDLAAASGVTRSTIANLETGRQQVPLEQLVSIARCLSVDYREFLPPPAVLLGTPGGPVTAETVSQRAPATASLIEELQQASPDRESNVQT